VHDGVAIELRLGRRSPSRSECCHRHPAELGWFDTPAHEPGDGRIDIHFPHRARRFGTADVHPSPGRQLVTDTFGVEEERSPAT
jgi:hypothetical protein